MNQKVRAESRPGCGLSEKMTFFGGFLSSLSWIEMGRAQKVRDLGACLILNYRTTGAV